MIRGRGAILALLTGLNLLNFIDRAILAAVLPDMGPDLGMSNFQGGLLNTAFLVGYFATCPAFGARADKKARKGLLALGVVIWSIATVGSGLATGFWTMLAARIVVGVGEASFAVLAPTIIDDVTPPERKGTALSVFYLAIPLGYAIGYALGGTMAKHFGWRSAFFVAGWPGVVIALTCLLIAEPQRKLADAKAKIIDGLREISAIPLFRRAVFGYTAFTASVAGFSIWASKFLVGQFPTLDIQSANAWFGLTLLFGGAIGTAIGGRYANRAIAREAVAVDEPHDTPANKRAVNGLLKICAVGMACAAPIAAVGFLVPGPAAFFILVFLVDIGLFASTSPVAAACLRSVPSERRASAMAASIFAIHMFGDLWSAAALGFLLDVFDPKVAMMSLPLTFAFASYLWWPRKREAASAAMPEARVHAGT
jgi:MFS family permease